MKFFLEKQLIKFSCTYQPLSLCKIFKKFLEPIQSYEDVPFSGPKWPICPDQNFFGTNHCYYFQHLPIGSFHCDKDTPFWDPKWSICHKQIFFWKKLLISISSNYWSISLCFQTLKKFLQWIQSYEDVPFLSPKWPICPNENIFRKPANKPCSFHSYLATCQKSKSDINLSMT